MSDPISSQHPDEITLDVYLDSELPAGEARQIEAHLEKCQHCRKYLQQRRQFFALIADAEQVSLSGDVSTRVIEKLQGNRMRLLTGVLSLEAVLAALILIIFIPMLKVRFSAFFDQLTLAGSLFWLGETFLSLGDQVQTGLQKISAAILLAPPPGLALTPVVQLGWLHWTGILGGIFFLWLLVNRILIEGIELRRSRV
jgi:predicted anti-sigma-YlaC factor YlaD